MIRRVPLYYTFDVEFPSTMLEVDGYLKIGQAVRCVRKNTKDMVRVYFNHQFYPAVKDFKRQSIQNTELNSAAEEAEVEVRKWEPESAVLEYKESLFVEPEITKQILAFANTQGGKLIAGLKDKTFEVTGKVDSEIQSLGGIHNLENKIRQMVVINCNAPLLAQQLKIEWDTYQGTTLCTITVPKSEHTLFYNGYELYVRNGASVHQLKGQEIENHFRFFFAKNKSTAA